MNQKRVTSVPQARIGRVNLADSGRGQYERAARAMGQRDFDQALTDLLGLPQPEREPPKASKRD